MADSTLTWEKIVPRAFDREWPNLPDHAAKNLFHLEREGAIYSDQWVRELGDFRHVRIRFTEAEVTEFVRRAWALELFLAAGMPDFAADVPGIDDDIASEADSYEFVDRDGRVRFKPYHCPAAFYGRHLERLVCGMIPERREVIAQMELPSTKPPPTLLAFDDAAIREDGTALALAVEELISPDESEWVEQKAAAEEPRKIAREIAAFATSDGGLVLIGVGDDGTVTGCGDDLARFEGISSKGIAPGAPTLAMRVRVGNKAIVAIRVYRGDAPVYYVDNRPYIRDGTTSRPASPEEVERLVVARKASPEGPQP